MEREKHLENIKLLDELIVEYKKSKGLKRDHIFKEIYKLVKYVYVATKIKYSGFNNIDIKSLSLEGLFMSLKYYDINKKNRLVFPRFYGTFLNHLIITNYYTNRLVSLPHDLNIRKPTRYSEMNKKSFERMKHIKSLNSTYDNSDNDIYVLSDNKYRPDVDSSAMDKVNIVLSELNPKEKYIMESYYGINRPKKTLVKIGKEYGVSRERIRQIVANTKNKILTKYKNMDEI